MPSLIPYSYTTIEDAPPTHRRIGQLAFFGLSTAQIAGAVEVSELTVRSVLAHGPVQQYQMGLQAQSTVDWMRYTDRFDGLMEKALGIVEQVLDASNKDIPLNKKKWAVEFVADRDPKRRVPKRTAQDVSHTHRLDGFSGEEIDQFNQRGRELMDERKNRAAIEVQATEVLPDTDHDEEAD